MKGRVTGSRLELYLLTICLFDVFAAAAAAKSLQSCPTLCDPIDSSPPGFPRPWDSPGKNSGVGCHFLLQCRKVKSEQFMLKINIQLKKGRKKCVKHHISKYDSNI